MLGFQWQIQWMGGGTRNMKSMRPLLAAIFFMTYFYRPNWTPWIPYWIYTFHMLVGTVYGSCT